MNSYEIDNLNETIAQAIEDMKKELGVQPYTFPMPILMIGTYNEDDSVDVMMMAWNAGAAFMKK